MLVTHVSVKTFVIYKCGLTYLLGIAAGCIVLVYKLYPKICCFKCVLV
jgi:hypothetical protein